MIVNTDAHADTSCVCGEGGMRVWEGLWSSVCVWERVCLGDVGSCVSMGVDEVMCGLGERG